MVKTTLVNSEIASGYQVLQALDAAELGIKVAAWVVLSEYEDWRLLLATPTFDRVSLREAYFLVREALDKAGILFSQTPILLILPMSDPLIRGLRRVFARTKSVEGMRLGNHAFGDRFVEDGIIYRIK